MRRTSIQKALGFVAVVVFTQSVAAQSKKEVIGQVHLANGATRPFVAFGYDTMHYSKFWRSVMDKSVEKTGSAIAAVIASKDQMLWMASKNRRRPMPLTSHVEFRREHSTRQSNPGGGGSG